MLTEDVSVKLRAPGRYSAPDPATPVTGSAGFVSAWPARHRGVRPARCRRRTRAGACPFTELLEPQRLGVRYSQSLLPVGGRPASPQKSHSKSQRESASGDKGRR